MPNSDALNCLQVVDLNTRHLCKWPSLHGKSCPDVPHVHLQIGDKTGQAAAQMNLTDIRKVLGLPPTTNDTSESADDAKSRTRRKSMENMDLLKVVLPSPFSPLCNPPPSRMAWDHGCGFSSYFSLFIDIYINIHI